MRLIRDGSVKRVLSMLEDLAKHDKHEATESADGKRCWPPWPEAAGLQQLQPVAASR